MREVMKKLGKELDEAIDYGANHRIVARAKKRLTRARVKLAQQERREAIA